MKKPDVLVQLGNKKKKEQNNNDLPLNEFIRKNMTKDDGYIYHR